MRIKLLSTGSDNPLLEMLTSSLSKVFLLLLQASLQQLYYVLLGLADEPDDPPTCTPFDAWLYSMKNVRTGLWVLTIIVALVVLLTPSMHGGESGFGKLKTVKSYALAIVVGIAINVSMVLACGPSAPCAGPASRSAATRRT